MGKRLLGIFDAQERHFDLKNICKEAENVKKFSKSQNFSKIFLVFPIFRHENGPSGNFTGRNLLGLDQTINLAGRLFLYDDV